jgi:DNA-binding NarL/FixJ family response regulator
MNELSAEADSAGGTHPSSDEPTRVLVVDDEGTICRIMKSQLQRDGHTVCTAGTVREGLVALQEKFDVVVLDVDLPDGKGFELVEALRAQSGPPTSVVMMTGNPNQDVLNRSLHQGILEFLFKPFRYVEMRAAIGRALDANRRWNQRLANLEGRSNDAPRGLLDSADLPEGEISRLTELLVERHSLTDRECETLGLILKGFQNSEIAQLLDISANTVKYHVRNLLTKLGMESRTDLFRSLLDPTE